MISERLERCQILTTRAIVTIADVTVTDQKSIERVNRLRLPKRVFVSGSPDGRVTEWLACFLIRNGWIPSSAYTESAYFFPPIDRKPILPHGFQIEVTPKHEGAVGRKCGNCCKTLPLTASYFHRDPKGKDGWHSICKKCRNRARREYYRRNS